LALKSRIKKIVHPEFLQKNLVLLKNILINNQYPLNLINKLLYSSDAVFDHPQIVNLNDRIGNDKTYVKLQFIHNLSPVLARLLSEYDIVIANYNYKKLSSFYTPLKDKTPVQQMSDVVYGIKCECGKIYIGQTSQKLSKRVTLHKSDCRHKPQITSLSTHVNTNDHIVHYKDAFILHSEKNLYKRKILEMCHVNNCSNSLNHKKDVEGLSSIYTYLLSQKFTKRKKLPEDYIANM